MPVRKISPSRRAITGRLAGAKSIGVAHYESALERDFLITLEADNSVLNYEIQPVRLEYRDAKGHKRHYTPDVLVQRQGKTELCEVKYSYDIQALRAVHKERWLVAHHYAKERGWAFRLITEHHARHPLSKNWLFLSPFRVQVVTTQQWAELKQGCSGLDALTIRDWLFRLPEPQAQWMGVIWHLVATGQVLTDLKIPLSLNSRLDVRPIQSIRGNE